MGLAWLACESLDPPQGRHGFNKQIFGKDEQVPVSATTPLKKCSALCSLQSGKGPGAFSVHGSDEQISGVNGQILGRDQSD
jgi:hypothetical protein